MKKKNHNLGFSREARKREREERYEIQKFKIITVKVLNSKKKTII
jgi:hypothetical protein